LKKDDTLIIKIEDQKDLKEMVSNFKSTQKHKDGLATLVDSKKFSPDISVECKNVLKIKLINYHDRDINDQVEKLFESKCQALSLTYESIHYTKDIIIYKVNYDEKTFVALQSFDAIASIEDMPMLGFSFDSLDQEDEELLEVKEPVDGVEYPIVGVLDSGIASNSFMKPWIEDSYSPYIESDQDQGHGSAVASIIVYGDELHDQEIANKKGVKLYERL